MNPTEYEKRIAELELELKTLKYGSSEQEESKSKSSHRKSVKSSAGIKTGEEEIEINYKTLYNLSPDPIFIVDKSTGTIIDFNDKVEKVYGFQLRI